MKKVFVFLGYFWRVVFNLIQLAVVVFTFAKLKAPFEIIVVAVLGLIYTTIRAMGWGLYMTFSDFGRELARDFMRLRRLLGDQTVEEDAAEFSEQVRQAGRRTAKGYIDMVFVGIISLFCIVMLLAAITT